MQRRCAHGDGGQGDIKMSQRAPRISLVVSTRGRSGQILRLLDSLDKQTMSDFELIVVEQNLEPIVAPMLAGTRPYAVSYLHTPDEQGASRGRNRGLQLATGDYVIFPDDDCWYPPAFLEIALRATDERNLDILTGRCTDEYGNTINGRFETTPQWIVRGNVWTTQIEWIAIWRRSLLVDLGGYDENVGVGALSPWQSAEGQDLMLRALAQGALAWYDPDLHAHDEGHDRTNASTELVARARAYGRGMGYVLRKHEFGLGVISYFLLRPTGGALIAAVTGKMRLAQFFAATTLGRLEGVLGRSLGITLWNPSN